MIVGACLALLRVGQGEPHTLLERLGGVLQEDRDPVLTKPDALVASSQAAWVVRLKWAGRLVEHADRSGSANNSSSLVRRVRRGCWRWRREVVVTTGRQARLVGRRVVASVQRVVGRRGKT